MKRATFTRMVRIILFVTCTFSAASMAQTRYSVVILDGLGGTAGGANSINDRGWASGAANLAGDTVSHAALWIKFQILQFRAVIWGPNGEMQELPPLPGDSTSAATAINDQGQIVGISGACGIAVGGVSAAHAVLWENGVPTDIGNLGGTTWNTPTAINSRGTVVGFSLPASQNGTRNYEAFIWTKSAGLHSLGKVPGDIRSAAFGVNNRNQVVGLSRGGPFGLRAFIWENGSMTDLNDLTVSGSPYLLYANDINNSGQLVGEAFDPDTGEAPAFLANPVHNEK